VKNMKIIGGIDEAGRGAVIGPMVIAGVSIRNSDEKILKEIGVKDSKKLSPKKRQELYKFIEEIAKDIVVIKVRPWRIDQYRKSGISLDKIEAMKMAQIIEMLNADEMYVDSLTSKPKKFEKLIKSFLKEKVKKIFVRNHLDETKAVVSAASIIAKVERDKEIEKIKKRVGFDFGVGYSHDKNTIKFLKMILKKNKELPPYVRRSWITVETLMNSKKQKKIGEFINKK